MLCIKAANGSPAATADLVKINRRPLLSVAAVAIAAWGSCAENAFADEGGISFWLPGIYGGLAATPQQPGWSLATFYYHTSVKAGGDVGFLLKPQGMQRIQRRASAGGLERRADAGAFSGRRKSAAAEAYGCQVAIKAAGAVGRRRGGRSRHS